MLNIRCARFRDGWVHAILSSTETKTRFVLLRFEKFSEAEIKPELANASFDGLENFNIGQDGTGNYGSPLTAVLDDFILYGAAISDDEVAALADYYKD